MPDPVVRLDDILSAMDWDDDLSNSYLHKPTGKVITVTEDDRSAAEFYDSPEDYPEWQRLAILAAREIDENGDDYLALPDSFNIDEYSIMNDFCETLEDGQVRAAMLQRIRGSGAFRHFKDAIYRYKIANQWFRYREQALERIAIAWLKANDIPYTRKPPQTGTE